MTSPMRSTYRCSFCGKAQEQVRRLIAGPGGVYICDECVRLCNEILGEEGKGPAERRLRQVPPKPPSGPTTP